MEGGTRTRGKSTGRARVLWKTKARWSAVRGGDKTAKNQNQENKKNKNKNLQRVRISLKESLVRTYLGGCKWLRESVIGG